MKFIGTRADHAAVQQALAVIAEAVKKEKVDG